MLLSIQLILYGQRYELDGGIRPCTPATDTRTPRLEQEESAPATFPSSTVMFMDWQPESPSRHFAPLARAISQNCNRTQRFSTRFSDKFSRLRIGTVANSSMCSSLTFRRKEAFPHSAGARHTHRTWSAAATESITSAGDERGITPMMSSLLAGLYTSKIFLVFLS